MNINNFDFEKYKKHPRVLEVRFLLFFNMVEREYGYNQTIKIFQGICGAFNCNFTFLQGVINNKYNIQKSKRNYKIWRQEIIFTAKCYGESKYKIAKYYLDILPSTLYAQSRKYSVEEFLCEEWLVQLDERVTICGQQSYRTEVIRFMEVIDMLADIMNRWKGGN